MLPKTKKNGFSLIEVIVAMFVFSVGIVAILGLASLAIRTYTTGKMRTIAANLAQEGVELVRDIRAQNVDWGDWEWYSDSTATSTSEDFLVQYQDADPELLDYDDIPLKLDANGLYRYNFGDNTNFYRRVTLTKISSAEVKVEVEMKWLLGRTWHYLTVEDRLWNWR